MTDSPLTDSNTPVLNATKKMSRRRKVAIALTLLGAGIAALYAFYFSQNAQLPMSMGGPCLACGMG